MGVLIDTSILIEHESGGLDLDSRVAGREEEPFFLSVVSVSELLHGVHRAGSRVRRARRSAFVESVIDTVPNLPIDLPTARMHARLWAELAALGTALGAHDLWIAAGALAHGLRLVTANVREFDRIPELLVEDWS